MLRCLAFDMFTPRAGVSAANGAVPAAFSKGPGIVEEPEMPVFVPQQVPDAHQGAIVSRRRFPATEDAMAWVMPMRMTLPEPLGRQPV